MRIIILNIYIYILYLTVFSAKFERLGKSYIRPTKIYNRGNIGYMGWISGGLMN